MQKVSQKGKFLVSHEKFKRKIFKHIRTDKRCKTVWLNGTKIAYNYRSFDLSTTNYHNQLNLRIQNSYSISPNIGLFKR